MMETYADLLKREKEKVEKNKVQAKPQINKEKE